MVRWVHFKWGGFQRHFERQSFNFQWISVNTSAFNYKVFVEKEFENIFRVISLFVRVSNSTRSRILAENCNKTDLWPIELTWMTSVLQEIQTAQVDRFHVSITMRVLHSNVVVKLLANCSWTGYSWFHLKKSSCFTRERIQLFSKRTCLL